MTKYYIFRWGPCRITFRLPQNLFITHFCVVLSNNPQELTSKNRPIALSHRAPHSGGFRKKSGHRFIKKRLKIAKKRHFLMVFLIFSHFLIKYAIFRCPFGNYWQKMGSLAIKNPWKNMVYIGPGRDRFLFLRHLPIYVCYMKIANFQVLSFWLFRSNTVCNTDFQIWFQIVYPHSNLYQNLYYIWMRVVCWKA